MERGYGSFRGITEKEYFEIPALKIFRNNFFLNVKCSVGGNPESSVCFFRRGLNKVGESNGGTGWRKVQLAMMRSWELIENKGMNHVFLACFFYYFGNICGGNFKYSKWLITES